MKVLIVGGGGREHAMAWKVAQSAGVECVLVAPGNAGTAREPRVQNVAVKADNLEGLLELAQRESVDLTIVGPEAPLVAGITDVFSAAGLACFGPTAAAARLEGSKAYSKDFLARHGIPTAAYRHFEQLTPALNYIREQGAPIVVKADGLAAGKGVVVAATVEEACNAAESMLGRGTFGAAGRRIVVEEYLEGEEASFIVIADGEHILPLATSQDHKARDDGDRGPNTGGMGAYSPAPVVSEEIEREIMTRVIEPTVRGLAADGCPYTGFLYAGLMIAPDGTPRVLEFNCRFGDPETQPIMMRLRSDFVSLCSAAMDHRLDTVFAEWGDQVALGVVMAAGGYPGEYRQGDPITGLPHETDELKVFHAGTRLDGDQIVTAGGRVLCVVALGANVSEAQRKAYTACREIQWDDVYFRNDIGFRAVARERAHA